MFDSDKELGYRELYTIVEIDLDINDPSIDFSGDSGSYNTPRTTSDPSAYSGAKKTYIFSDRDLLPGTTYYPYLKSAKSTSAELRIGESAALSASATLTFSDFVSNDVNELPAPYDDRRVEGSFWGKLLARNYLVNREVRILRGYSNNIFNRSNFQIENYIIQSVTPPSNRGEVSIKLIDRLFYTTETKAKCPIVSNAKLTTLMDNSTSSINFTGESFGDKGIGLEIVNGQVGYIKIDEEILNYTVTSYSNGSGSLSVSRGDGGTIGAEHEINATIQGCFITQQSDGVLNTENITDVNRRLIRDFTRIEDQYINDAEWNAEKAGDLNKYNFTNIITKPTDVRKLIDETIKSSGSWMYFDVIDNNIKLGITARFEDPVLTITDETNIVQGSMKVSDASRSQVTRAAILYNKLNYAEGNDDKYFGNSFIKADTLAEDESQYAQSNEAKEIKSNWYTNTTTDIANANSVVQLKVERFRDIPTRYDFEIDTRDIGNITGGRLWFGSIVSIQTRQLLNPDGTQAVKLAQITQIKPSSKLDKWSVTAISYNSNVPTNVDYTIDTNRVDFNLANEINPVEVKEYVVVINSGIILSSTITSGYSFDQGVFPVGATLKIINQGFIVGKGGMGGTGGQGGAFPAISPTQGEDAGDAINLTTDTTIDNLTGLIGGGGGGGAGGFAFPPTVFPSFGSGGGGGAGNEGGLGGLVLDNSAKEGGDGTLNGKGLGGSSPGIGEDGADGGDLGENGQDSDTVLGGMGGNAIVTNGNSLAIIAGDNADQIKGAII